MQIITKNNRQYYKFKIGDEFSVVNGKGSFNKMKKEGLCSDTYNEKLGYIYPMYSNSIKENHIIGYTKTYFFEFKQPVIRWVASGNAGQCLLVQGKVWSSLNANFLISKLFNNEYTALLLSNILPKYASTTIIPNVIWKSFKDEYIEIPINHEKLSKIVKRILEHKKLLNELSKKLSKQIKDYKLAILQESEKAISIWKQAKQFDKYVSFKIGEEFSVVTGKGSYNKMKKEGLCSDTYNEKKGYIYPFYDASTKNNHIKGYCKIYNNSNKGIKFSRKGDAGLSTYNYFNKSFFGDDSFLLLGVYSNFFSTLLLNKILPNYATGSVQKGLQFNAIWDVEIHIPKNHEKLSKKIEQLNIWQIRIEQILKQMEEYIDEVLKSSLSC